MILVAPTPPATPATTTPATVAFFLVIVAVIAALIPVKLALLHRTTLRPAWRDIARLPTLFRRTRRVHLHRLRHATLSLHGLLNHTPRQRRQHRTLRLLNNRTLRRLYLRPLQRRTLRKHGAQIALALLSLHRAEIPPAWLLTTPGLHVIFGPGFALGVLFPLFFRLRFHLAATVNGFLDVFNIEVLTALITRRTPRRPALAALRRLLAMLRPGPRGLGQKLRFLNGLRRVRKQFQNRHHPVPRIKQLKTHLIKPHQRVGLDQNVFAGLLFQISKLPTFAVAQKIGDLVLHRQINPDHAHVVGRDRELAHDVQAHAFGRLNQTRTPAMRAVMVNGFLDAGTHALASNLNDAKLAHMQHFGLGAIVLEILLKLVIQFLPVPVIAQVDKVANDHAAQVAQLQLTRNLVGRFHVRLKRRGFSVGMVAKLAAVHVDRDHRLGLVDHQRAARWQRHVPAVHHLDLFFDPVFMKQRNRLFVQFHLVFGARAGQLDKIAHAPGNVFMVNNDAIDIVGEHIAHRAGDQVAFRIKFQRAWPGLDLLADLLPQTGQIRQIALNLRLGLADPGRADDESAVLRRLQRIQNLPQPLTLGFVFDLARDAHLRHSRHHHQNPPGNGQITGQRRPLGADAFLDDLHHQLVAAAQAALNGRPVAPRQLVPDALGIILAIAREIRRKQIRNVQETVATQPKVHKRGLNRRLDVHHATLVDIADVRRGTGALDIKLIEAVILQEGDSALLALGDVNQHVFCHKLPET